MGYVHILTQLPDKLVFGPHVTKALVAVRDDNLYLADKPLAKFNSTNDDACLVVEPGSKQGRNGLMTTESKHCVESLGRK